jgi:cytochrome c peroxidase
MLIPVLSRRRRSSGRTRRMPTRAGQFQHINRAGTRRHPAVRFFRTLERMNAPASRATSRKPAGRSAPKACKTDLTRAPAPPIFRLVDGATCPSDDVSSLDKKEQAYRLLLNKGLIRIGLPIPTNLNPAFQISVVIDVDNCNTNPSTNTDPVTGLPNGIVSIYRRPLPSTNLGFLDPEDAITTNRNAIMWDGRESSLEKQSVDATVIHAQANGSGPSAAQQQEIVNFEMGLFTAQSFDNAAQDLDALGATGGPVNLQRQLADFFPGINDPFGQNPKGTPFSSNIFNLFQVWSSPPGHGAVKIDRESVARGETVFNTTTINITGVAGINDTWTIQFFGFLRHLP